jgi:hypothetical protein
MKKKSVILSIFGGVFLIGSMVAILAGGGSEETIKEQKPAATPSQPQPKIKTTEEIPPHRDNEEDKTPEVLKETKQLAVEFVKAYASLDPKQPDNYLEQIKPITDQKLYGKLEASPRRPTINEHEKKVLQLQTFPVDDIVPDRKKWNVIAFVETRDELGNTIEEQVWYWVSVAKNAGEWKITGVEVGE